MEVGELATILSVIGVIVGYGIWVGGISQRVKELEKKEKTLSSALDSKLDALNNSITQLNIQIAEIKKDIQFLKDK